MRTSDKPFYAVPIGRLVVFMARPEQTRQKKYREPIVARRKRYRTVAEAKIAAKQWEGLLV